MASTMKWRPATSGPSGARCRSPGQERPTGPPPRGRRSPGDPSKALEKIRRTLDRGRDDRRPGIVSTQAHTTRVATPQRTAESRRVAPTPTIAPVMVWVVDTGMPAAEVKKRVAAAADLGGDPARRLEPGDLRPHRLHDAPATGEGAERDRGVGAQHHPQRHAGVGGKVVGGDEQGQDHAHRLLGVVGAVAEAERAGGEQLAGRNPRLSRSTSAPVERPRDGTVRRRPRARPMRGDRTMNRAILRSPPTRGRGCRTWPRRHRRARRPARGTSWSGRPT